MHGSVVVQAVGDKVDLRGTWDNSLGPWFHGEGGQPIAIAMTVLGVLLAIAFIFALVCSKNGRQAPPAVASLASDGSHIFWTWFGIALLEAPLWLAPLLLKLLDLIINGGMSMFARIFHLS